MSTFEEMIAKLIRKRDELAVELARIEQAIQALRSAAPSFRDENSIDTDAFEQAYNIKPEGSASVRAPTVIQPGDLAVLARKTLLEIGRPLKRGPLVRAMEERNIPIAGKDKAKNLGTILWRHEQQFVSLEGLGYWPRDKRYRNVYDPANPPDGVKYVAPDAH